MVFLWFTKLQMPRTCILSPLDTLDGLSSLFFFPSVQPGLRCQVTARYLLEERIFSSALHLLFL